MASTHLLVEWKMILTQIVSPSCIIVPLASTEKEVAITELVDVLGENKLLLDRDVVLKSVLMREQTRSTGIGSGVAIPHGKCDGVKELVMAVGIAHDPIDFASVDDKPVKLILLLVSPANQTGPHIQALAKISRLMLDEEFKKQLEESDSAEQAYELLSSRDDG